ncbi:MAG: YmdB family metallophosphoesterase [Merdibacter sp.]
MVRSHLPLLTSRYQIDLVVANGENAAHGKGITRRIYHQLIGYGIDVMTMGNHTFAKSDLYNFIAAADRMVRPMNMAPTEYGRSVLVREVKGKGRRRQPVARSSCTTSRIRRFAAWRRRYTSTRISCR